MKLKLLSLVSVVLMALASQSFAGDLLGTANGQEGMPFPAANLTAETSQEYIQSCMTRMGSPATVVRSGTFEARNMGSYSYWLTKMVVNNYTVGNNNYGEITMGVVYSPADNWMSWMPLNEFNSFLYTGNRALLHLPNLNVDGGNGRELSVPNLNVDPVPAPAVNNLTVNNVTNNVTVNNVTENRADLTVNNPTVAPAPVPASDAAGFVSTLLSAYNHHDFRALAPYLVSGRVNYFGHRDTSDAFIRNDMANDARTYASVNTSFQPETFKHEVSNEYSSHWEGPMVYDSITAYTEAREFNGKVHSATTRFTVGYTSVNGVTKIYAMVDKVL